MAEPSSGIEIAGDCQNQRCTYCEFIDSAIAGDCQNKRSFVIQKLPQTVGIRGTVLFSGFLQIFLKYVYST